MRTPTLLAIATTALVALAGCGSSSKTTSSSAQAGAGGAYGKTPASTTGAGTTSVPAAATSTGASSASGEGVAVTAKHSKLGTILAAGPKKMTVYLFEKDKGSTSTCTGACEGAWPPVTTSAAATASGGAASADLGTIMRPNGTKQVTYKGHPLYFFEKDEDSGDAYGQGSEAFGAKWYVLKPSGEKLDES